MSPLFTLLFAAYSFAAQINPDEFGANSGWHSRVSAGEELHVVGDLVCARKKHPAWAGALRELPALPAKGEWSFSWRLPKTLQLQDLNALLGECALSAGPNSRFPLPHVNAGPAEPGESQEHLELLRAEAAWKIMGAQGLPETLVAVVDTGIDLEHADLKEAVWRNGNDEGYKPRPSPVNPGSKHGSHVAGLVGARGKGACCRGINPRARLLAVNVFGDESFAKESEIANGVRYAVARGAKVLNISIAGSAPNSGLKKVLKEAVAKGATIVVAAGNAGHELSDRPDDAGYFVPAIYSRDIPGLLSVASIDAYDDRRSDFSNFSVYFTQLFAYGNYRSAPAAGLLSTVPGGKERLGGTSMSAPLVAGALALARSWLGARGREPTPPELQEFFLSKLPTRLEYARETGGGRYLDLEAFAKKL